MPIFGHFSNKGGGKSDEDDHRSVFAVSGVLRPPGEEERKKNHLILSSGTQYQRFSAKNGLAKEKQEKSNTVPSL